MTHQSYSNSVEDGALESPSCSNSTESSQVYSLPLGLPSQIDICNEDQRLVSILNDLPISPNPIIIDSNGVKIGNEFNVTVQGDAHFHTNATGTEPPIPIPNGSCTDVVCCLQKRSKRKKRLPFNYQEVVMPAAVVVSVIFVLTVLIIRAMIYHVAISKSTLDDVSEDFDDGFFVSRKAWGAVAPKSSPIVIPPALLAVVKHTGGPTCSNQKSCKVRVREIQKKHMEEMMFPDISYNFLIGGDERIYEGRGWGVQNEGRNDSLDLAFIGNFSENVPTSAMLFLARRILIMGRQEGGLDYLHYYVVGHNQTEPTDSPGVNLFKEIKRFNHYSNATCYKNSSLGPIVEYECPPRSSDVDIDAL